MLPKYVSYVEGQFGACLANTRISVPIPVFDSSTHDTLQREREREREGEGEREVGSD